MPSGDALSQLCSNSYDTLEKAAVAASISLESTHKPASPPLRIIFARLLCVTPLGVLWSLLLAGVIPISYQWLYMLALIMTSTALIARFVVYDAEPPKAEAGVSPLGLSSQKLPIKQQASSSDVDQTLPDSSIAAKQPTSPKSSIPSATFHARVSATSSFRSSTAHPVAVQPAELALSPDMALLAPLATGFQSGFNVGYSSGIVAGIIVAMMRQHGLFPTSEIQACSLAAMPLPARHKSPVQHRLAASAQNKTQATNTTRKHTVQSGLDVPALPLHQSLANAVPRTSDKPGESGLTQWATVQWSVKSRNHLLVHSEAAKPTVM